MPFSMDNFPHHIVCLNQSPQFDRTEQSGVCFVASHNDRVCVHRCIRNSFKRGITGYKDATINISAI